MHSIQSVIVTLHTAESADADKPALLANQEQEQADAMTQVWQGLVQ